ncbi:MULTISPECIES: DoxX family protein [Pseudoalteromonas]|nr:MULTISPECIES: DoxX family protein [Pseudoalteromonas]
MFFKNIAMAGGFLALAVSGAGKFSIDSKLSNYKIKAHRVGTVRFWLSC